MNKLRPHKKAFILPAIATVVALPILLGFAAPAYAAEPITNTVPVVLPDGNSNPGTYTVAPLSAFDVYTSDNQSVWQDWQKAQIKQAAENARRADIKAAAAERTKLIADARTYENIVPYVFGGATPAGWDCSGYTQYVFNEALNIQMAHSVNAQSVLGHEVSKKDAQPGDLVIFSNAAETNFHVGIYLGGNTMIHAPYPGVKTRLGNINWDPNNTIKFVNLIDDDQDKNLNKPYYSYDVDTATSTVNY